MADGWLIIELSDNIDNPDYCDIDTAVRNVFGERVDYFIPIHYEKLGSYTSTLELIQGYVFVKDCEKAREGLANIRDNRLFIGPICSSGKFQTINAHEIVALKNKIRNRLRKKFAPGTKVRVLGGALKDLIGEVVGMDDGGLNVMVRIVRTSREILAPVPATLVEKVEEPCLK